MENVNTNIFNMIMTINESKTLTKYISCIRRYQIVIQIKSGIKSCVDVSAKNPRQHCVCEED